MSIRSRLLESVSSFLSAVENDTVDKFNHSFTTLVEDMDRASCNGILSEDDRRLGFSIASTVESMAAELDRMDSSSINIVQALGTQVDTILSTDDCHASCSEPHDHTLSAVPFTRSPTPDSPQDALARPAHPTYARSSASASDDDSDSDSVRNTTTKRRRVKKGGPENPANFRHLRDWFIAHMDHPFPTAPEKKALAEEKSLPLNSINLWFTNMRRRSGWTAAQTEFANSDPKVFRSLINQYNRSPNSQAASGMSGKAFEEIDRIRGYIDERGQERVRDYMVAVIQDGIDAAADIDDDEEDDDNSDDGQDDDGGEEGGEGEQDVQALGWGHAGDALGKRGVAADDDEYERRSSGYAIKRGKRESGVGGEGRYLPSTLPDEESTRKTSGQSASTSSTWTDEAPTPQSYRSFSGASSGPSNSPPFTDSTSAPTPVEDRHFMYPVATQSHLAVDRPIASLPRSRTRTASAGDPSQFAHFPPPTQYIDGPSPQPSSSSSFGRPASSTTYVQTPDVYDRDYAGSPPKRRAIVSPTFHPREDYHQRPAAAPQHPRQYRASPEYTHAQTSPAHSYASQEYYTSPQHSQPQPSHHYTSARPTAPLPSRSQRLFEAQTWVGPNYHDAPNPNYHPNPAGRARSIRRHATQPYPSQSPAPLTHAPVPMQRSTSYQHPSAPRTNPHSNPSYAPGPPEGFADESASIPFFQREISSRGTGGGGATATMRVGEPVGLSVSPSRRGSAEQEEQRAKERRERKEVLRMEMEALEREEEREG